MHLAIATTSLFDVSSWLESAGVWALVLVCAIVFAETGLLLGFFLPGDTLLFVTGVLTVSGEISQPLWLVLVLVTSATIIGGELGYEIGRRGGPAVFERKESGFISKESVARAEQFFDRFGPATVGLARFVAVVRTVAPVAAGVGRMPRRSFSAWNAAGAIAWVGLLVTLGYALGSIPGVSHFVSTYLDLVLVGLVVLFVTPVLVRVLRDRRKHKHAEAPDGRADGSDSEPGTSASASLDA
ncbi:DedA family protein [Paraoerskovia sediminicola]|nr:DedA family protein [Paraoerskovia sediminicola]